MAESQYSTIRIKPDAFVEFNRLRLRVSAEIGWTIPAGDFALILTRYGNSHEKDLTRLAKEMT